MLRQARVKTLCMLLFLLAACLLLFGFKSQGSALPGQLFESQPRDGRPTWTRPAPPQPATQAATLPPLVPLANITKPPVVYTSLEKEAEYWRTHSKETGHLPDEAELKTLPPKDVQLYFHSYLDNMDTLCHRTIRLGTIFNGGYRVCDDEEYRPRVPCIVYSFGLKSDDEEDENDQAYGFHVQNCARE